MNLREHLGQMLMLPYIIVHTFIDMVHIGDISDLSHIASGTDARANCWQLHSSNILACHFVIVHSHLFMYHHLLGHREMSISCIWYQYSFEYDLLHC